MRFMMMSCPMVPSFLPAYVVCRQRVPRFNARRCASKQALVAYCPYAMGRSADLWPEPLKFDPLRFYQQPRPSAFKYSAFQAGPRVCLGQNMALFEASVCLATIFKHFTMEPLTSEKPAEGITVTLPMRDGFPVRLRRRNA